MQVQFVNTYSDLWEYKADFFNICFQDHIGHSCPICGQEDCHKPIQEYYRYVIELFPYRKDKIPVARFLCCQTGGTFSLLPCELIPYHLYTVNAMVGTLLMVYDFQKTGQKGYYAATLELDPDCFVTPYLAKTWALLLLTGYLRGHHALYKKYSMPESDRLDPKNIIATIVLYFYITTGSRSPDHHRVISIIRYHFVKTGKWLFGKASCDRARPP